MKKKINENEIIKNKFIINKNEFPYIFIKPKIQTNKALIFIPGLNGNGSMCEYWDYEIIKKYNFFSFDLRAQANNYLKPSRFKSKYIDDLNLLIKYIKENFDIKNIILLGESWGGALCSLYHKKYRNEIDGFFTWNTPFGIVDTSIDSKKTSFLNNLKVVLTYLTNINTYNNSAFCPSLTNDKVLLKAISLSRRKKVSNKVILASWKSFKPSWKYLIKNQKNINFNYCQSLDDVFYKKLKKPLNKLKNDAKDKVFILDHGVHILSFDKYEADKLFNELITNFVNKTWKKS